MKKAFIIFICTLTSFIVCAQTGVSQFADPTGMYSTGTSGICVCSFSNTSAIADNDLGSFATVNVAASVFGATRSIKTKLNNTVAGNTRAGFYINVHSVIPLLPTVTMKTYKTGTLQETIVSNADMITLAGGSAGNLCGLTGLSKPYDEVELIFNMGTLTATASIDVYYGFGGFNSCPGAALPVKLIAFNVVEQNKFPVITWKGQTDEDAYYELQRSTDGNLFTAIYNTYAVAGKDTKQFSFIDKTGTGGNTYYRLVISGSDRQQSINSKIININLPEYNGSVVHIYPNPSPGRELTIQFNGNGNKQYQLQIYDQSGRLLANEPVKSKNNNGTVTIHLSKQLPAGLYYTRLIEAGLPALYYSGTLTVL
jgi:hypothetical protein